MTKEERALDLVNRLAEEPYTLVTEPSFVKYIEEAFNIISTPRQRVHNLLESEGFKKVGETADGTPIYDMDHDSYSEERYVAIPAEFLETLF